MASSSSTSSWGLLDEKEENELHRSRLLNVEEKPYKRVTKRLMTLHALATSRPRQAPTPPPEKPNGAEQGTSAPTAASADSFTAELMQLKEDIILDFAAFDSSIARLQFLMNANERERERYAAERERIINTSQAVRDNTAQLRLQLDQARQTLEQRRTFDELADKINSNPALKSRTEQTANLRKLEEEIAELEAESKTYGVTWHERRDQFAKIMDESMRLRRLIRDEKEEVERREGMDGEGGAGDADADIGHTPRPGLASGNGTPRPESGLPPKESGGDGLSTVGGRTPARESPAPTQESLKPRHDVGGSFSQNGSLVPSRDGTPDRRNEPEDGEDVEMGEMKNGDGEDDEVPDSPLTPLPAEDTPRIVVDGHENEEDKMDTT
ncbi:Tho complex subunit 7-domain-containing protein [Podospora appendiculata]|uniref:Tho complex subunit 7-domain-containing protein n=1 Tax=Podospora appendiculata TaxID=314037 RepID=A0AAE0XKU1_9PEZI|nr:Tho complex subunit 7-domain-containing protein [Podospora appendiculata]